MGGRPRNTPEVIWSKIDQRGTEECWPWKGWKSKGKRNKEEYGRLQINGKSYYAHRVVFYLCNPGLIELSAPDDSNEEKFVMHSCDNPICCNPNHLSLGSHLDNMQDKVLKGRQVRYRSAGSPRAKFTEDDVRWIRLIHKIGKATIKAQALLYNVHPSCIGHILYSRTYQDID